MKKRVIALTMAALMAASLTACGGSAKETTAAAADTTAEAAKEESSDAAETKAEESKAEAAGGTLVMATNAYFQPYEYYDGDNIVGIDVDIAQAICDKLGYDLKVEDMEFDAIVNAVKSGKADFGAAGMTVTEDRKKSVDFTDPYTTAEQVIIVQK